MANLGSEVVILSIDDVRRLLVALLIMNKRDLQELGILDVVMELQAVVREFEGYRTAWEVYDQWRED